MKCRLCDKGATEIGGWLERVNETGVAGVWECRPACGTRPSADEALLGAVTGQMTAAATSPGDDPRIFCHCGHALFFHSGRKGAEACMNCPCPDFRAAEIVPLAQVDDPAALREMVTRLWGILDDIDTASDAAKADDGAYRRIVEKLQGRRRSVLISDGYGLFVPGEAAHQTTPIPGA